jgi:hypothetical protein
LKKKRFRSVVGEEEGQVVGVVEVVEEGEEVGGWMVLLFEVLVYDADQRYRRDDEKNKVRRECSTAAKHDKADASRLLLLDLGFCWLRLTLSSGG